MPIALELCTPDRVLTVNRTQGVTTFTSFPKVLEGITPAIYYSHIFQDILATPARRLNQAYLTTPLTSGGAIRLFRDSVKPLNECMGQIIQMNGEFAETVGRELQIQLLGADITLPHRLNAPGWSQLQYNSFWMYYLTGPKPLYVGMIERWAQREGLLHEGMNDRNIPRAKRLENYQRFLDNFLVIVRRNVIPFVPVGRILLLPDHHMSFGGSFEKRIASALNIPVETIVFHIKHPRFAEFTQAAAWFTQEDNSLARHISHRRHSNPISRIPYKGS